MKHKAQGGMTLLEVVVAMSALAILLVPLMNLFIQSSRSAKLSEDLTVATYTAQLRMEELVGMNIPELLDAYSLGQPQNYPGTNLRFADIAGVHTGFTIDEYYLSGNGAKSELDLSAADLASYYNSIFSSILPPDKVSLVKVTVTVYDEQFNPVCHFDNVLNVEYQSYHPPGGTP